MIHHAKKKINPAVALRKESVDRNGIVVHLLALLTVALRKESVDRNVFLTLTVRNVLVALRKESVDRNFCSV